jgi:hypothetical protein
MKVMSNDLETLSCTDEASDVSSHCDVALVLRVLSGPLTGQRTTLTVGDWWFDPTGRLRAGPDQDALLVTCGDGLRCTLRAAPFAGIDIDGVPLGDHQRVVLVGQVIATAQALLSIATVSVSDARTSRSAMPVSDCVAALASTGLPRHRHASMCPTFRPNRNRRHR